MKLSRGKVSINSVPFVAVLLRAPFVPSLSADPAYKPAPCPIPPTNLLSHGLSPRRVCLGEHVGEMRITTLPLMSKMAHDSPQSMPDTQRRPNYTVVLDVAVTIQ